MAAKKKIAAKVSRKRERSVVEPERTLFKESEGSVKVEATFAEFKRLVSASSFKTNRMILRTAVDNFKNLGVSESDIVRVTFGMVPNPKDSKK